MAAVFALNERASRIDWTLSLFNYILVEAAAAIRHGRSNHE